MSTNGIEAIFVWGFYRSKNTFWICKKKTHQNCCRMRNNWFRSLSTFSVPVAPPLGSSVTRFGEISPLRHKVEQLWPLWKGSFCIWQNFEHNFVNFIYLAHSHHCNWPNRYLTSNLAIWSHCLAGRRRRRQRAHHPRHFPARNESKNNFSFFQDYLFRQLLMSHI